MRNTSSRVAGIALAAWLAGSAAGFAAAEWQRLPRAMDYIAEERWTDAVRELRAAAEDPKERSKDQVLYWLAHSLNQAGDSRGALETIRRLEREHPKSLWVKPAGALKLEIAMRYGRNDVLWHVALAPKAPPAPPAPRVPAVAPTPKTPAAPPPPPTPATPPAPAPPAPLSLWIGDDLPRDVDLRIQALGHLIRIEAEKAIPLLRDLALEPGNPEVASRAVFLLAQSRRPEARETVVQVARTGPPEVRVAAVRELARFGGPEAAGPLLQVYSVGDLEVKRQVVRSLGDRWARAPLLTIVRSESNPDLKSRAIVSLGRAGGAAELRDLYVRNANAGIRRAIIRGLAGARAEDELIEIARSERNPELRQEILDQLRLLGTPKAVAYLKTVDGGK